MAAMEIQLPSEDTVHQFPIKVRKSAREMMGPMSGMSVQSPIVVISAKNDYKIIMWSEMLEELTGVLAVDMLG